MCRSDSGQNYKTSSSDAFDIVISEETMLDLAHKNGEGVFMRLVSQKVLSMLLSVLLAFGSLSLGNLALLGNKAEAAATNCSFQVVAGKKSAYGEWDEQGTNAQMKGPFLSLLYDKNGTLYSGHYSYSHLRTIDSSWNVGTVTDKDPVTNAAVTFNNLVDMDYDNNNNLYLADNQRYRILKRASNGTITNFWVHPNVSLQSVPANQQSVIPSGAPTNYFSSGLSVDRDTGYVYLLVGGTNANIVLEFNSQGAKLREISVPNLVEANSTEFSGQMEIDAAGNLYIADGVHHRILKVKISDGSVSTFAGSGTQGDLDGQGTNAQLDIPRSLYYDQTNDELYVTERSKNVRKITKDGYVKTLFGPNANAGCQDVDPNVPTNYANAITLDPQGNIVIGMAQTGQIATVYVPNLSPDATLLSLTTSQDPISPTFDPTITSYTKTVGDAVSSMTVTPTTNNAKATLTVNGTTVLSGTASGSIPIKVGTTTITVEVTAEDGTIKPYTITVTRANKGPIFSKPSDQVLTEDTPKDVTLSSTDANGDPITYSVTSGGSAQTVSAQIVGNKLTLTPANNYSTSTPITFTVKADDGNGGTDSKSFNATVTPVNDAPTLTSVTTFTGATEDTEYTISYADLVAAADEADVDGDTVNFRIEAVSTGTLKMGTTSANATAVTAGSSILTSGSKLFWTSATNANGTLNAFTIKAHDGSLLSASPVQVKVTTSAVNDAPTISTVNTFNGGTEEVEYAISYSDLVSAADESDIDGDPINFRIDAVSSGTLKVGTTSANATPVTAGSTLLTSGSNFYWTPVTDANGTVNAFTIKAHDGALNSVSSAQVKVNLGPVNDAPTLTTVNTLTGGTEDTEYTISYANLASASNEADVDGDTINFRVEAVSSGTLKVGTTSANATPVTAGNTILSSGSNLYWTPVTNANGTLNAFTIKAHDGALLSTSPVQVKVSVGAVNDAPTLTTVTTLTGGTEDTEYTISYADLANASDEADIDGDTVNFQIAGVSSGTLKVGTTSANATPVIAGNTILSSGFNLYWTPATDANGTLNALTIKAHDGSLTSATPVQIKVTVGAVNDAPTITTVTTFTGGTEEVEYAISYADLANASDEADIDGDTVNFQIDAVSSGTLKVGTTSANAIPVTAGSTILSSGSNLYWTPEINANGTLNAFTIKAHDGALLSTLAVSVSVNLDPVNDAPTLTTVEKLTGGTEDVGYLITYDKLASLANEEDVDGDTLSFRVEDVTTGRLTKDGVPITAGSTLLSSGESLLWRPAMNAYANLNAFTVIAYDGALYSTIPVQVQVNVRAQNDQPTISGDTTGTMDEDTVLKNRVIGDDTENDELKYVLVTQPKYGKVTLDAKTGAYSYTPNTNFVGTDTFTIAVSDGELTSDPLVVTITIKAVNDAPVLNGSSIHVLTGQTGSEKLTSSDLDGDKLTYSIASEPKTGKATINSASGELTYQAGDVAGDDSIVVQVTDGNATAQYTVQVTIQQSNRAPVFTIKASDLKLKTKTSNAISGKTSATDSDGNALTYMLKINANHGVVTVNGTDGSFTYKAVAKFVGTDHFSIVATDGFVESDLVEYVITVDNDIVALPTHYKYMSGYADGQFKPDQGATRAEIAAALVRLTNSTGTIPETPSYKDIKTRNWFFKSVEVASENKLMSGYADNNFYPNHAITRTEMTQVIGRLAQLGLVKVNASVLNSIGINWLVDNGKLTTVKSNESVERVEAVIILNRLFKRGPVNGFEKQFWSDVKTTHVAFKDIQEASVTHDAENRQGKEFYVVKK